MLSGAGCLFVCCEGRDCLFASCKGRMFHVVCCRGGCLRCAATATPRRSTRASTRSCACTEAHTTPLGVPALCGYRTPSSTLRVPIECPYRTPSSSLKHFVGTFVRADAGAEWAPPARVGTPLST